MIQSDLVLLAEARVYPQDIAKPGDIMVAVRSTRYALLPLLRFCRVLLHLVNVRLLGHTWIKISGNQKEKTPKPMADEDRLLPNFLKVSILATRYPFSTGCNCVLRMI